MERWQLVTLALILILLMGFGVFYSENQNQQAHNNFEKSSTCSSYYYAQNETIAGAFQCSNLGLTVNFATLVKQNVGTTTLTESNSMTFTGTTGKLYFLQFSLTMNTSTASAGVKLAVQSPTGTALTFCATYNTPIALADEFNSCTTSVNSSIGTITLGTTNQISISAFALILQGNTGVDAIQFAVGNSATTVSMRGGSTLGVNEII